MKILILSHDEIVELLPVSECVRVMREALTSLANGLVYQPLRTIVRPPDAQGLMGLMPSYISGDRPAYGLKAICLFANNPQKGKDAHQGGVLLFSAETGELLALMNASAITAIRTAAVSGVATDVLARNDAVDLAIIGAGVQAHTHLAAISSVRPITRCRVASQNVENTRRFTEREQHLYRFPIEAVETVEAAVTSADIVVTATTSSEPVVYREWISNGTHLNVVGSSTPWAREVDSATMAASSLFVDRTESTIAEAGDYLFAVKDGSIAPDHIRGELGEVLTGRKLGRTTEDEITLFKSLGLAVEDLAAANYLYTKALASGTGTSVEFGA